MYKKNARIQGRQEEIEEQYLWNEKKVGESKPNEEHRNVVKEGINIFI